MSGLLHTLGVMGRAARYGVLLPRTPAPRPAPDGTRDPRRWAAPWSRARHEVGWFTHTRHRLQVAGLSAPVRVLHISDVHLRGVEPWLESLAAAMRGLTPDLIAITGDVVTKGWTPEAVELFLRALPQAPLGRWAAMGNWEHWTGADPKRWAPMLQEHDVRLLVNQHARTGPLLIAATDDLLAGRADIPATLHGRPPAVPTVLMSHSPAIFSQLDAADVPLMLSGHAHGGQIRLPLLGPLWVPRGTDAYVAGWFQQGDHNLFVSRGVGWSIAPVRAWCAPELACIHLEPAQSGAKP